MQLFVYISNEYSIFIHRDNLTQMLALDLGLMDLGH